MEPALAAVAIDERVDAERAAIARLLERVRHSLRGDEQLVVLGGFERRALQADAAKATTWIGMDRVRRLDPDLFADRAAHRDGADPIEPGLDGDRARECDQPLRRDAGFSLERAVRAEHAVAPGAAPRCLRDPRGIGAGGETGVALGERDDLRRAGQRTTALAGARMGEPAIVAPLRVRRAPREVDPRRHR